MNPDLCVGAVAGFKPGLFFEEVNMRLTLEEWLQQNSHSSAEEALADYSELDAVYPALCPEDSEVEPDGHRPHGAPSLLLALGLI